MCISVAVGLRLECIRRFGVETKLEGACVGIESGNKKKKKLVGGWSWGEDDVSCEEGFGVGESALCLPDG